MYGGFRTVRRSREARKRGARIPWGCEGKNEGWLRDTLFENPEIIPVNDIDSTFGPLVPLCKELRTEAGQIDAVFINERGRLTIVECKLWKNPQARREVVAQTLHYVSAISGWSYADLQRQVAAAGVDKETYRSSWCESIVNTIPEMRADHRSKRSSAVGVSASKSCR
jgi:hypothetical protein